jgi:integrase
MAFVRVREGKTGTHYLVVDYENGRKIARSAKKDRRLAYRWAARLTEQRMRERAGFADERGFKSTWTLEMLRDRDLEEARLGGREVATRRRRWDVITAGIGPGSPLLHEVTSRTAEAFRIARLRVAAGSTVNRDISVLSAAWELARRNGEAKENPWRALPRAREKAARRRAIAIPEDAAARLIAAGWARAVDAESWRAAAIVELLFLTASRLSQVLRLRREQIQGRDLVFAPQKGGAARTFALSGRLRALVGAAASRSPDPAWLFPSDRAPGPRREIRRFWTTILKDAGLVGLRRHDLRHSAATLAAYRGASLPSLQELMGHGSPRMASEVYSHVHQSRLKAVVPRHRRGTGKAGSHGRVANGGS